MGLHSKRTVGVASVLLLCNLIKESNKYKKNMQHAMKKHLRDVDVTIRELKAAWPIKAITKISSVCYVNQTLKADV